MLDRLRPLLGFDPIELAGARASGEIPIPAALINRLAAERLADSRGPVSALTVEPRPNQTVLVRVRLRTSFVPPLTVHAAIVAQPRLPESPVFVLRWSLPGLGALARLASPVMALLEVLPPGIRMDGDRLVVNLADMLAAKGRQELLPLLRHVELITEEGRIVVRFDAGIDAA